jgi:hypothetical protein
LAWSKQGKAYFSNNQTIIDAVIIVFLSLASVLGVLFGIAVAYEML